MSAPASSPRSLGPTLAAFFALRHPRKDISASESAVLTNMLKFTDSTGLCSFSLAQLAEAATLSEITVARGIERLLALGAIAEERPRSRAVTGAYRVNVEAATAKTTPRPPRETGFRKAPENIHGVRNRIQHGVASTKHGVGFKTEHGVGLLRQGTRVENGVKSNTEVSPNLTPRKAQHNTVLSSEDLLRIRSEDHPPNPQRGDGPSTSRTPESLSPTKAIPSPTVEVVTPQPAFTLTPPEPEAPKAPKRSKTTTEPQKLTTPPTMPEAATPLPAKASPAPKAPKGKKPPEERSDAKYLRAFDAGIAKGAGIPAFATPPHGLTRQTLIAIAKTHAVKDGEPITGEDLLAWFEARAAAFRKYAADVPDLKFNGGWSPKGLLWWLNGGCLGEPKPPRPPRPIPPAAIDAPDWEMPESAKGKTLEQLMADVGKPRSLIGPMPEDELQFLREAQARGQAKYKAMREEMAKREAAEVAS